jgi:hypothetical protein
MQALFVHGISGLEPLLGRPLPEKLDKGAAALCACILCSEDGDGTQNQHRDDALTCVLQGLLVRHAPITNVHMLAMT